MMSDALYRDFNSYLRRLYGCRVQKIIVDAGLTCPNRDGTLGHGGCIYCNARGSGSGAALHSMSITDQLAAGKSYLARRYKAKKFLAYFQSFTNTYAPFAVLKELYAEALSVPDVVGLTIGTRPDCVSDEVLDHLHLIGKRHLVWLEYGLQSAHDKTLALINRGHNVEAFSNAVERTRRRGIPVCAHVILGLPGESREDMMETARFLAATDLQALKIHLLYVIRGTELETWFRAGKYECLTRADYAATVSDFLALLPPHLIIQRVTGDPHPKELIS
ncbi:MAG: TIGR01212 family radical SAM protein, partial [Desulforhabdus sp.]|nr:TIGR01212 family radical SAM protein [Desulforhabdus sp.]